MAYNFSFFTIVTTDKELIKEALIAHFVQQNLKPVFSLSGVLTLCEQNLDEVKQVQRVKVILLSKLNQECVTYNIPKKAVNILHVVLKITLLLNQDDSFLINP